MGNGVQHTKKANSYTKNITKKKLGSADKVIFFISRKSRVIISYKNSVKLIDTQNTYKWKLINLSIKSI